MDSLTDERNTWFNAVRLEDSHDYSSATLAYLEDASRCLGSSLFIRAAMSTASAASCLVTTGDNEDAIQLYSAAASLYEHNADVNIARSMRESLWSLLHAFEYFTLISDHVSAERASKKYADLARRVDRFETRSAFETLKNRRDTVLVARSDLASTADIPLKGIPDSNRIQLSMKSFLQQVQTVTLTRSDSEFFEEAKSDEEEDHLVYETESDFHERSIVS